jgi:hypothetical protein
VSGLIPGALKKGNERLQRRDTGVPRFAEAEGILRGLCVWLWGRIEPTSSEKLPDMGRPVVRRFEKRLGNGSFPMSQNRDMGHPGVGG